MSLKNQPSEPDIASVSATQEHSDVLPIAGFRVRGLTRAELTSQLLESLGRREQRLLFFVNTNFVNQCGGLRSQLNEDAVVLVSDGVGMDIASWIMHRRSFPENLNGTDFVPYLLTEATRHHNPQRVFLMGGRPGIARRAAEALAGMGIDVVGALDGFEESSNTGDVVAAINNARADVVLVAMGNPRQEQWILANGGLMNAGLLVGVGALLDFLAGDKPRAPKLVQKCRLEWLYRLSLEPRRLLRRYTVDILVFLNRCRRAHAQSLSSSDRIG